MARELVREGAEVFGGFRRGGAARLWRLKEMALLDAVQLVELDLNDMHSLVEAMKVSKPHEIYHLAGHSYVADSLRHPNVTMEANTIGTLNVLVAAGIAAPDARVFLASSSEAIGNSAVGVPVTETSLPAPRNPYGLAKLCVLHLGRIYRETQGLHVVTGILFNHESPWKDRSFVTRKITVNLARLAIEGGPPMPLGDLSAERDWGDAEEFVGAMRAIIRHDPAEDFVVSTGKLTSVRSFVESAARAAGFDPQFEGEGLAERCVDAVSGMELAVVSPKYFRNSPTPALQGDSSRLAEAIGWRSKTSVEMLASKMVEEDKKRWIRGEHNV